ncbi:MAG: hypothetical protein FJY43_03035 [Betaproteobacteria bacterium]|nr:hypothetical protein [Betaproteobacteria bacterium]
MTAISVRVFLLALAMLPALARGEAIASTAHPSTCLTAKVDVASTGREGNWLYRVVFDKRCGVHRSLYWCAENPGLALPEQIACPKAARAGDAPAEPRHQVLNRKEFQWHLPPGTRIRFRDCPAQELPTYGPGCTAAATARDTTARR